MGGTMSNAYRGGAQFHSAFYCAPAAPVDVETVLAIFFTPGKRP